MLVYASIVQRVGQKDMEELKNLHSNWYKIQKLKANKTKEYRISNAFRSISETRMTYLGIQNPEGNLDENFRSPPRQNYHLSCNFSLF